VYDVIVARLRCPGCTTVADAEIQTHLRGGGADGTALRVGSEINPYYLIDESIVDSGYARVHAPGDGEPIRLLDVWTCPHCKTEQWAMVEIADGKIRGVEAVELDRETLESANYIAEVDADLLAGSLAGDDDTGAAGSVELLRQRLPARGR
jgi:hypothetical protein